jgi:hypothetical protein
MTYCSLCSVSPRMTSERHDEILTEFILRAR